MSCITRRTTFLLSAALALVFIGGGCTSSAPLPGQTGGTGLLGTRSVVIDLQGQGLTAIPEDLLRRDDISYLDVSDNAIGTIPAEIRHMTSLEVLNIRNNALTGLPAELGQLEQLRILDVSGNDITGLPYELGNLTQLEEFDLRGNPYSEEDLARISEGLTSTVIRTEDTALRCSDLPSGVKGCTKEFRPVCGAVRVECITTPCDPVPETFPNACVACQNERVETYTDGPCQE